MADSPPNLRSRLHWQLGGIADCLRNGFQATGDIEVGRDRIRLRLDCPANPLTLTLSPAFPGSWVQNDVAVQMTTAIGKAATNTQVADAFAALAEEHRERRRGSANGLDVDANTMDAIRYASYAPLRNAWVDRLYRSGGRHALILLHYGTDDPVDAVVERDMASVTDVLRHGDFRSVSLMAETEADTRPVRAFTRRLTAQGLIRQVVFLHHPKHMIELFALIGKADLLMTGGSSLYADGIVAGVPVFAWRAPRRDVSSLSEACIAYLKSGERGALCDRQYQMFEASIQAQRDIDCVPNRRRHLLGLLDKLTSLEARQNARDEHWIINPATPPSAPSLGQQTRQHLHRRLRLVEKFSESPTRFMADSQHRWVRRLHGMGRR